MTTRMKRRAAKANPETDQAVYDAIFRAILEGKLKAGTKLAEKPLAEIFAVSRERIRKVLARLGAERRLEMIPNRGARVPQPTLDAVRSVYEAHRILEAGIVRQLVEIMDEAFLARLDAHLAEERLAAERGDRAASVKLSGAFHLLLVDRLNNPDLSRFLRDLLSRSSVMVSVYESAAQSVCGVDEHALIVEALRARDAARAVEVSRHHFLHVEERLHFEGEAVTAPDLATVFGQEKARARGRRVGFRPSV